MGLKVMNRASKWSKSYERASNGSQSYEFMNRRSNVPESYEPWKQCA